MFSDIYVSDDILDFHKVTHLKKLSCLHYIITVILYSIYAFKIIYVFILIY